ncbi:hypothetical protein [Sporosalibacterium faouarense]|uniref:hypothetical protein n=1 Tax=Sporosalibacterium faouarense TaxID=516123 RepID=UPI00192C905D|nr:hypothetical protein [Sporosalibacterium faouarense]
MKKNRKLLLYSLVGLIILIIIQVFIVPVSYDAKISTKEFKECVVEKYAYDLGVLFVNNQNFNPLRSYNYNRYIPQVDELIQNMRWKGRIIYTSAINELDGVKYIVKYRGERYWYKTYRWTITSIIEI